VGKTRVSPWEAESNYYETFTCSSEASEGFPDSPLPNKAGKGGKLANRTFDAFFCCIADALVAGVHEDCPAVRSFEALTSLDCLSKVSSELCGFELRPHSHHREAPWLELPLQPHGLPQRLCLLPPELHCCPGKYMPSYYTIRYTIGRLR
jgi:hypothetical protein